ncbi:hypothetical protein CAI16_17475 [Virgibacillus dokdonensis]|uniref:YaaC-like Protein n=1 Tax=Virgibacillus dokdonensis TaxID=302167 RepID=A0A3E0WI01_9BACI|nr:YaaC family protein [Virgibacillus dokdonensis]RFA32592.1 hypothetical protein CAI16_17475 [Virgibacillus dokdonensis]
MLREDIFLTYLQSQQTAQSYLHHCYVKNNVVDAEVNSYHNCNAFLYYMDHGKRFFEQGRKTELFMQPILYFYGMVHLIKACLLTKRPHYPESTNLLAHGVTARKKKKKNYHFLNDEVKIQHNGLFPYFSEHLFALETPFEKRSMQKLLALIPEMQPVFQLDQNPHLAAVGRISSPLLEFPVDLLDSYHLTEAAFIKRIQAYVPPIKYTDTDKQKIRMEVEEPILEPCGPFFMEHHSRELYFPIYREDFFPIHEVMIHYLVLYNLSMLGRYETEWWGDLFVHKADVDFPYISHFLELTAWKTPALLMNELYKQRKI